MTYAEPASNLADVARPFAWIAAAAFVTGMLLGLAVHLGRLAGAQDAGPTLRPSIVDTAPHGGDAWNLRKAI